MKTISIRIPAIPHHADIIKALVQREDLNKPYSPIILPSLSYPKSTLKGPSLKAFLSIVFP